MKNKKMFRIEFKFQSNVFGNKIHTGIAYYETFSQEEALAKLKEDYRFDNLMDIISIE